MANRLHGKGASLTLSSGYALHCMSWDIDLTCELSDGTEFGMFFRTNDPGLLIASGSFSSFIDSATAITICGYTAVATFKHSTGKFITITSIIIEGIKYTVNVGANQEVTHSWKLAGDGTITNVVIT